MRKAVTTFIALFALFITAIPAQAQLFEDFEDGSKGSYAAGSVTLASGDWFMEEALLGNLDNDNYNGTQGVRLDRRDGIAANIYMEFDYPNGASEISFYLANYGSSSGNTLQVQYSTDQGSNWQDLGEAVEATENLREVSLPVDVEGNIRFKFVHASGDDRMNLDDVQISDYIAPAEEPTLAVDVDGSEISSGGSLTFSQTTISSSKTKTIEVTNLGNEPLVVSEATIQGNGFSLSDDLEGITLGFNESAETVLTFSPDSEGAFQGQLQINSNATNESAFTLDVLGEGIETGTAISIAEARELSEGTQVTVSGHVTVTDEFAGPVYFQDESGGIAWFDFARMREEFTLDIERGDSVVVTGEIGFFNDLLQIVDATSYSNYPEGNKTVEPVAITVQQMNSGDFESQLVSMNVDIDHSGAFQGNTNYDISDNTGTGELRIDNFTNLVGAEAPQGETTVVGVVGQFRGTYQLLPRDTDDVDAEETTYPGEDISRDETFEVVTWNIEWFGSASNGPEDDQEQFENVMTVVETIDAEVYAFQEISNPTLFADLVDSLEAYGGVLADFSQNQKTAYLFKRSEIDSLDSGVISDGMTSNYWAGGNSSSFARFPLMFNFTATIDGQSRDIFAFNIHAKAFDDSDSYNQRENASRELKLYLDQAHGEDNVIFLGDYNDNVTGSITSGQDSPYKNFVDDTEYTVITQSLEDAGFSSQSSGSVIDHITITSELSDEYFEGTERVENTNYIGSYLSSTSDHYPIWTRFTFEGTVSNEPIVDGQPTDFALNQNYPNPFNPTTVISYQLAQNSTVNLKVYDMLGREVASLVSGERMAAGSHEVQFDASNLSSGMYIYRLSTAAGQHFTRKMMLIK
ncbi:T9SS type A sorting domain-containing protein [Gracilimonas mengyeensis]|nr:T9SS type A sorting domain-containing protein [Gracilimonas mengyeensis]